MRKIVKVLPFYEPRMWGGGDRLREEFHYDTDVEPLGEVYNVVALEGHADCEVPEMNMTLAQLYKKYPQWFECDTEELPVRVNILDPMDDLSIQIHPDDDFAKQYNGGRGKPEAWVILDTPEDGMIEFGHHAKTKEEFVEWTENREWKKLLRYLKAEKDGFIDIPAGTLHAIGKGVLTYNISRNADLTLRLYDYDRVDPSTGKTRDIQPEEPGLYTLMRLQVEKTGKFLHDRFAFYTCVKGEGTINGVSIRQGETILVPTHMGWMQMEGNMDLFLASYRNENI